MSRAVTFQEAIETIKMDLDVTEVIGRYVSLKKRGRNYLGLCPFHKEKTPSFNVNRERGMFKCFGCGEGGDALAFLMKYEGKGFGDLIRELAEDRGITIEDPRHKDDAAWAAKQSEKEVLLTLHELAGAWFQRNLLGSAGEKTRQYLTNRGMETPAIEMFQLGYALDGWDHLSQYMVGASPAVKENPALLDTAGLANPRQQQGGYYDRFRNRLIIPIHDMQGRVIAFGGRGLSPEDIPKYLNSPETPIYKKHQVLYGIHLAKPAIRKTQSAIVMEGYFDVISAHLAGLTQTVGSCGTALTEEQLKLLFRQGAETVYFAFDSDEAGIRAALSAIQRVEPFLNRSDNLKVKVVLTPEGKDPDEFIRTQGAEAFLAQVQDHAVDYLRFKLNQALRDVDVATAEGRIDAVHRITPILSAVVQPIVRSEYIREYSGVLGVSEEALGLEVKRYLRQRRQLSESGGLTNVNPPESRDAIFSTPPGSLKKADGNSVIELYGNVRRSLSNRQLRAEHALLSLVFWNTDSCMFMLSLLQAMVFSHSTLQTIWTRVKDITAPLQDQSSPPREQSAPPPATESPISVETLKERLLVELAEDEDARRTLAELVLSAESLNDTLGLAKLDTQSALDLVQREAKQYLHVIDTQKKRDALMQMNQRLRDIERSGTHQPIAPPPSQDPDADDTPSTLEDDSVEQLELHYQFQENLHHARSGLTMYQHGGTESHE